MSKLRCNSTEPVELPDGIYNGRHGGKEVFVRLTIIDTVKFKVDYDMAEISIPVWVTVKNKKAAVESKKLRNFDKKVK